MSLNRLPAEPATFEDLYMEHASRVHRLLALLGVQKAERADAAQEVWIAVHVARPRYDASKATERAWIGGFAHNVARNWRRTRQRRPEFSTSTDAAEQQLAEPRTAEAATMAAQQQEALSSFLERAIPNADQRAAFVLHEIEGMMIEEVAEATGVKPRTARGRIEMARSKVKSALGELTEEERERMRAVILPLGDVDGIIRALRETAPKVSDDEIAQVWDRVVERIEATGGSIHDPVGVPATPPPTTTPKGYTFTGAQLVGGSVALLLTGAFLGAGAFYFLWPRDQASVTTIMADIPSPGPSPDPAPSASASAAPSASASAVPSVTSTTAAAPWESEAWILDHARKGGPAEALLLADRHALRFPRSNAAAEREEIAIGALVKLGRRPEAEQRAARLVRWAPSKAPAMEELFGRSLL